MTRKSLRTKRIFSIILSLAVALTMMPMSALAVGDVAVQAEGNVAEVTINGTTTQYTDIEAAFTAAQTAVSATVKLLKNVTLSKKYDYGIQLTGGNITLDLNGHTIQTTGGASDFVPLNAVFYINDGSSLTVQDKSTNGGKIVQPNGGQAIHVGGALTVESGVAIEVTSTDESRPSTTMIRDKNCAIFLNGGTANILGGTLTGKQGIYVNQGALNVSGGTIRGNGSYALWVVDGSAALTGGSYTTGVENGCSIWNSDGTAAALLGSGYRYQDNNGKESAYSEEGKGVVGNTTVAVRPANEFSYEDANGKEQTQADCSLLTADGFTGAQADTTTWFAANTDITANDPLQVLGTVNLILCDGATVTLKKGIYLENEGTLNIYAQNGGTGTLEVTGNNANGATNAGIYISTGGACTTALNIYGGNITATGALNWTFSSGDLCGAGIGTNANYDNKSTMEVNISGGTVTAKSGGPGAAAIGRGSKDTSSTVTVTIAPGMKCVKTDDQNTACDPGNTDGTSVTVTKCSEHEWKYTYTEDSSTHTKTCKLCGFDGGTKEHSVSTWTSKDESQHIGYCVCGKTIATESHDMQYYPNTDGLTHKTSCNRCGWTSADEKHTFGEDGACVCGIRKSAEYNGTVYASLQAAVNAAAASGGTVTLARDVSENVTVTGGTLTIDLNRNQWSASISAAPNLWGLIPLTVTGGSVTLEKGTLDQGHTSSMGSYGIRIQGGSVTVKGTAVVIGSNTTGSAANISYPAIRLESGGALTLETGATLVYGLEVPEDKTLSDYLPAGTAFGLRSYDGNTKTWTVDKGLLNAYTINNYAEHDMALVVVEHTKHEFELNSDGKYVCACGYVCPHNDFKDGKCTSCGNGCAHTNVNSEGVCENCEAQMAVKITASDNTVTYGTDFKSAMRNATNGTTVTLLADIELGTTPQARAAITGDGKIVTLDLNGHKITSGWLDVGGKDTNETYTTCTLKIIGKGSYEPPMYGGIITVDVKATLDLSEWEGGTISAINISDDSNVEKDNPNVREAAVIVGPKAGTIGKLTFGNNQLGELKRTKLSGGSFNEIRAENHQPVKLGELLADGYAFQNGDGSYVEYETTLQDASIYNVKVVKCLHPNMEPDAATGIATCKYCGTSGKFVASVDGNTYEKWDEAITYWLTNGGTLKLYADYTAANGTWSIGSGLHTVNLNGHKMSVQGDGAFFKPTNNMHLTVTDDKEIGQITNILLDGSQGGSFTLESGYVGNLKMTGGAVAALKGGSVDKLDVRDSSADTKLSIQGGSIGELNIKDWAEGMHVSATSGSLGAYHLPSGKILADVLDHQYYATGTSLDRQVDTAQKPEKFDIKQAPYDFGSTSKTANVPINGSIPFTVAPSGDAGVYDVKWYRRTDSGAEHMTQNRVAGVNVGDTLDVFCVITGADRPGGAMKWQVAVKGYTIKVVPAKLNGDQTVIAQKPGTGNTRNPADNRLVVTPFSSSTFNDVEYKFEVTYNGQPLELNKDYTIKDSSNRARNAGTYTLTIVGMGNYTGEKSVTWTLEPYELSVENLCHAQISKTYDGTDAVTDSTNGIDALNAFSLDSKNSRNPILSTVNNLNLDKSDYELSNMKFDSAEAGDRTFTGTMTLKPDGNFVFAGGSRVMQIECGSNGHVSVFINRASIAAPAAKALQVANNHAATYTVDLSALLPVPEAPKEYGALTYEISEIKLNDGYYTSGAKVENGKLILPIQKNDVKTTDSVGTVTVVIKSTNYEGITLTVNVNAANKLVPTVTAPTANALTYNGAEQALVTAGKTTGGTMLYQLGDSEWSEQIPTAKNAGEYTVWYKVQGDAEYADVAEQNVTVVVAKKAVTVTALGKSAYTGSTAPDLSSPKADKDYKVEGLIGADTLSGTVTLAYEQTPDMSKTGKTAINITGTLSNDNYEITYVPGTLTVSNQPSSGGGGIVIPVQKPEITTGDGGKTDLSDDGTTIKITPDKGKEVDKVLVNGKDIGAVTEVKDLKPGDKVEVIFKDKIKEPTKEELDSEVKEALNDMTLKARSAKTSKKNIRINVIASITDKLPDGYTVKYKYYRSTKKASGYKFMTAKNENYYINTKGTKGTRYYYKVRIAVYDNDGKLIAQTELKQCKYAERVWTKQSKSK